MAVSPSPACRYSSIWQSAGVVYDVDNQSDGPNASWYPGGVYVLGSR